jgi:hypothetical protein
MSSRYARLLTAVLAGTLAACSSNGTPSATPRLGAVSSMILPSGEHVVRAGLHEVRFGVTLRHAHAGRSWIDPAVKKKAILYASSYDGGFINVYSQKGTGQQPIGQLTSGLLSPQGMFVDGHHTLWVANTNAFDIVAFKRNATAPFLTLNDPDYYPIAVVVDHHGTAFAANAQGSSGQPGTVTYWKKGDTDPTGTITISGLQLALGIGVDAGDNVYVSYIPTSGPPMVAVVTAGTTTGQPLGISGASIGDITFDSTKNLVMEDAFGSLGIWARPYNGGPARTLPAFGNEPTLDKKRSRVWIAYANFSEPMIESYDYASGQQRDVITAGFTDTAIPSGVALDPAAKP